MTATFATLALVLAPPALAESNASQDPLTGERTYFVSGWANTTVRDTRHAKPSFLTFLSTEGGKLETFSLSDEAPFWTRARCQRPRELPLFEHLLRLEGSPVLFALSAGEVGINLDPHHRALTPRSEFAPVLPVDCNYPKPNDYSSPRPRDALHLGSDLSWTASIDVGQAAKLVQPCAGPRVARVKIQSCA